MKKYFLHNGTEQQGPFDIEDLKSKNIDKDTPMWYEGIPDWTTAGKIDDLKELIKTTTPPQFGAIQTPPPLKKTQTRPSNSPETPKKKKKLLFYSLLSISILIIIGGSFWFYKYSQHQKTIKQQEIEMKLQQVNVEAAKQEQEEKRQQIENTKKNIRNNWSNFIKVERSSFTYRKSGGIYDLYIIVENKTDYTLDDVFVSISYIKTNGDIYKTETIYFDGIAPHYLLRKKAPDSDRGTRVDYLQITGIKSNDLNFCYDLESLDVNSPDPFRCN